MKQNILVALECSNHKCSHVCLDASFGGFLNFIKISKFNLMPQNVDVAHH